MESDRTYFMRRAAQERSAAVNADGKARDAHLELAERYQELTHLTASAEDSPVPTDEQPSTEAPSA